MSNITVTAATRRDLEFISDNLRPADFEEFLSASGRHPFKVFARRVLALPGSLVALMDGEPIAAFGIFEDGDHWSPWLMGTDKLATFSAAKAMLLLGRTYLAHWYDQYGELKHHVYAKNTLHIRYLEALGCKIGDPQPFGPFGAQFKEFRYVLCARCN